MININFDATKDTLGGKAVDFFLAIQSTEMMRLRRVLQLLLQSYYSGGNIQYSGVCDS